MCYEASRVRFSRSNRRGLALLTEILIALSILIPVMVIIGGMFTYSFSIDRRAWNERTARSLARSAIEAARGQKFEDMRSATSTWPPAGLPASERSKLASGGTDYNVALTVDPDGHVDETVKQRLVRCVVTWRGKNGEERIETETTVARVFQRINEPAP